MSGHACCCCTDTPASLSYQHRGRFAVTLLALGNGAPDLSASIAAVRSGSYHLAVGSLLGELALLLTLT